MGSASCKWAESKYMLTVIIGNRLGGLSLKGCKFFELAALKIA
jgi:hypothetical protein